MPDLIAQGPLPQNRWRRRISPGEKVVLGRASGTWSTPWDDRISRRHAEVCWHHNRLEVCKLESASNPVFVQGRRTANFYLRPGEHFVIGQTTFTVTDEQVNVSVDVPRPVTEQSYSSKYLKGVRFRDANQRIDVLSRLPEIVSGATSDSELFVRLVNVLLSGIPRAAAAAIVSADPEASEGKPVEVLHWDRRTLTGDDFQSSERLILETLRERQSVVHVWRGTSDAGGPAFTANEEADWAFCVPVEGEACRGWAIYVAGKFVGDEYSGTRPSDPHDLRDDLKFAELAATTLGNLRGMRILERSHASLSNFFSPVVLEALAGEDPDKVLAPREAMVTVLFCDLRGFSRKSEQSAGDLLGLLKRVSESLGVMTRQIREQGGVVGDFHGDAAMGFWGWPLKQEDSIVRACLAALSIRTEFESAARREGHALSDFRIGIGVATGNAVAGKIGTVDQVKVTVFGPVVNLASRLEGMTKTLRAPILLDRRTALAVREKMPSNEARVRRVAVVLPYGLDTPVEVNELLPPAVEYPQLTDENIAAYEQALDALLDRDFSKAFELLHQVPADDRVKDFLTVFIAQHNRTPPADWDGVIQLTSK
jgi:adenylate cyclase